MRRTLQVHRACRSFGRRDSPSEGDGGLADRRSFAPYDGGSIDFLQCTKALLEIGHDGWITMECLALDNGKKCAQKALNYSRALEAASRAILSEESV